MLRLQLPLPMGEGKASAQGGGIVEILERELCAGLRSGANAVEQVEEKGKHGKIAQDAISACQPYGAAGSPTEEQRRG